MAIWDKAKDASVDARRKDEEHHARAMHEVQSGQRRDGLWAKAVTSTGGDEAAAKLVYFKLLVQAIRDDDHIAMRSAQVESSIAQQTSYQSPPPPSPPIPKPGSKNRDRPRLISEPTNASSRLPLRTRWRKFSLTAR